MGNLTLARRDAYFNHLKSGIKPDKVAALWTAQLHIPTLFLENVVKRAEEEIAHFLSKGQSSSHGKSRYHPYEPTDKRSDKRSDNKGDQPRASTPTLLCRLVTGRTAGWEPTINTKTDKKHSHVNFPVVKLVHTAPGLSQRKEVSPGATGCCQKEYKLNYVKGVSWFTQLSCVKPVTNVQNVTSNLPVGARLQNFCQTWLDLGATPKVVQILREGYNLPFQIWPNLTRSPKVISCYVNPHRNLCLLEALHQLMNKNAVELVNNQRSLGFFNQLFLVPKPNNK